MLSLDGAPDTPTTRLFQSLTSDITKVSTTSVYLTTTPDVIETTTTVETSMLTPVIDGYIMPIGAVIHRDSAPLVY